MAELELTDIQGNLLHGYGFPRAVYTFFAVQDASSGRAFLNRLLPRLTDTTEWRRPPEIVTNLAITFRGLQALEVDEGTLVELPFAFSEAMAERAARVLGDTNENAPARWKNGLGTGGAHLLVSIATSIDRPSDEAQPDVLANAVQALDADADEAGVVCVHRQEAHALKGRRDHFGYADGFGQPALEGVPRRFSGGGQPDPTTGAWADIKVGEFIHGYPDEDGEVTSGEAAWLLRNGTYVVYRKLEEDVELYNRLLEAAASPYHAPTPAQPSSQAKLEYVAAKLVGRWRDGVALEYDARPDRFDTIAARNEGLTSLAERSHRNIDNDFVYGEDLEGYVCPRGAHIRRANPRDVLDARRHRIIRRGMPYADDSGRGLIFICFNADFERQFELIQTQWCHDGDAFGLGGQQDCLINTGTGVGVFTSRDAPPLILPPPGPGEQLVVTRGCEYLLMPGLAAVARIADPPLANPDLETIPDGEAAAIARVSELVRSAMGSDYDDSRPVRRGQHPKSNGCVRATFVVDRADVPDELAHGLFSRDGRYDAVIRFSGSHMTVESDERRDAHGMAVKVLGLPADLGYSLLLDELAPRARELFPEASWRSAPSERRTGRTLLSQDFVLVNHDVFFCRDALAYVRFAEDVSATGTTRNLGLAERTARLAGFFLRPNSQGWRRRAAVNLYKVVNSRVSNPLETEFWSQTPYALGNTPVKYMVRPSVVGAAKDPAEYDGLEQAVAASVQSKETEFRFEFLIQTQTNPTRMPVEDPTVRWLSPFRRVATIVIKQDLDVLSPGRRAVSEQLSFSPWHSLVAHRPLGGINRSRRAVYLTSSRHRWHENGVSPPESRHGLR